MTIRALMNMMTAVSMFILLGFFVREFVKPLQKLFLPASLVGGLIMLALGQQGAGLITVPKVLGSVPGVLIDISERLGDLRQKNPQTAGLLLWRSTACRPAEIRGNYSDYVHQHQSSGFAICLADGGIVHWTANLS